MKSLVLLFMSLSAGAFAQQIVQVQTENVMEEVIPDASKVKFVNGVNYHVYSFNEKSAHCTYVLQRKVKDGQWEMIGTKDGLQSPNGLMLTYCFKDSVVSPDDVQYRMMKAYQKSHLVVDNSMQVNSDVKQVQDKVICHVVGKKIIVCFNEEVASAKISLFRLNGDLETEKEYSKVPGLELEVNPQVSGDFYVLVEFNGLTVCPGIISIS
ncbi:MAG: hypothetical protein K1X56_04595 [Flavobacteriales bacterium]|nr:hypothetical protein [Flavobacteriales bacterium]